MKLPQQLPQIVMESTWASLIEPFLNNPSNNSIILKNVSLTAGANVVNHLLGRKLVGWEAVRVRAAATIYDTQDTNQTPQLTLNLVTSAPVIVDLRVF